MPSADRDDPVERARQAKGDASAAARAVRLVDLTSLGGDESALEVARLCRRAIAAGVAAVCVYPSRLAFAREALAGSPVRLAAVANFPHGGDDIALAAEEAAAAVGEGAHEVDVVAPLAAIREGDLGLVGDLVGLCRAAVGPGITLKLILETGELGAPELIAAAARTAVMAGIDFLKTSTGKTPRGASLEAAAVLLSVIAEAEGRVGLKISGGIRTTADAAPYLALADAVLGADWVRPERFRIGASSLLDDLLAVRDGRSGGPALGGSY
jgi:deoxyribose-phosphate aldolase